MGPAGVRERVKWSRAATSDALAPAHSALGVRFRNATILFPPSRNNTSRVTGWWLGGSRETRVDGRGLPTATGAGDTHAGYANASCQRWPYAICWRAS